MDDILLYDSTICRLCAENNTNGVNLFTDNSEYPDLSSLINRYLPLKVCLLHSFQVNGMTVILTTVSTITAWRTKKIQDLI